MTALPARKIEIISVHQRFNRYDPTRTTSLRNAFVADMKRRFAQLERAIAKAIVEEDCFGLEEPFKRIVVQFNPCHDERGRFCSGGGGLYPHGVIISEQELKRENHFYIPGRNEDSPFKRWLDEGSVDIVRVPVRLVHQPEGRIPEPNRSIEYQLSQWKDGVPVHIVHAHFSEDMGQYVISDGSHRFQAYSKEHDFIPLLVTRPIPLLTSQSKKIKTHADITTPGRSRFDFPRSADKVSAFMGWLNTQVDAGILEVTETSRLGESIEAAWTNKYIKDSYERGVARSRWDLAKAGYKVPDLESTGGIFAAINQPFHADRLGVLYIRAFSGLKGITSAMDNQISQVLAQGIADGDNPKRLAKKLLATVNGDGAGDLGITDSLGRFIPAKRRAMMLARTEIIRAHAQAQLQEMKNWGALGVTAEVEFQTAGYNVCPICQKLQGKVYTIEEAMNVIPVHPHCFLDKQIPIYTSSGWKQIGDVVPGDLVLTHKGRFRKVYGLPRTHGQRPKVVRIWAMVAGRRRDFLSLTENHLVMVYDAGGSHWAKAGDIKAGDRLMLLASNCRRCGAKIPWHRTYCSGRCCSLDITDRQWANPEHRRNISEKNRKAIAKQYSSGERDRFSITRAANEKVRQMVLEGKWGCWMDEHFFKKIRLVTNTEQHRKASSDRMKKNNPTHDPETRARMTASLVENYRLNPERRLNARMAKHRKSGRMTSIEKKMAMLLDRLGIDYVFQYPIMKYDVDFAIPGLMIAIECDGSYWHKDRKADGIRQERIEGQGWTVLRYDDDKINRCLDEIGGELCRILANHAGQYGFIDVDVERVEHWIPEKAVTLYNLAVEEDESYVAKGVVVHNCRCAWAPVPAAKAEVKAAPVPEKTAAEAISEAELFGPEFKIADLKGTPVFPGKYYEGTLPEGYGLRPIFVEDLGLVEWSPLMGKIDDAVAYTEASKLNGNWFTVVEKPQLAKFKKSGLWTTEVPGVSEYSISDGIWLQKGVPDVTHDGALLTAKVNVKNPYTYSWDGSKSTALTARGGPLGDRLAAAMADNPGLSRNELVRKILIQQGYDGLVLSKDGQMFVAVFDKQSVAVYKTYSPRKPKVATSGNIPFAKKEYAETYETYLKSYRAKISSMVDSGIGEGRILANLQDEARASCGEVLNSVSYWQGSTKNVAAMALKLRAYEIESWSYQFVSKNLILADIQQYASRISTDEYLRFRALNQAYLEFMGKKKITLWRGTEGQTGDKFFKALEEARNKGDATIIIQDANLSGYARNKSIAESFSRGTLNGTYVKNDFNVHEIFCSEHFMSGITSQYESEVEWIVIGGKRTIPTGNMFGALE